jgi:electron transport complex protein RnfB
MATTAPLSPLAAQVLDALPQTQCTRCGYPDCTAYAAAVAAQECGINRCPPGGAEGVQRLAAITGQPVQTLAPECGSEGPRTLAVIDENWCIGCTLCIDACPTDAILGTHKRMHTVMEAYCTGCELCVPACPVDCIALENTSGSATGWSAWTVDQAQQARNRYAFHSWRRNRDAGEQAKRLENKARTKLADLPTHSQITAPEVLDKKRAVIEAALERARARQLQSASKR